MALRSRPALARGPVLPAAHSSGTPERVPMGLGPSPVSPVWPDVRTDRSAFRADHARTERGYGEIAREMIDIHDHLVAALVALDRERPHAVLAHVGEVHWLDRSGEAGGGHLA
jgi:hypothetical protein